MTKIVNAMDVLPPSLVKLIQRKLEGRGLLLYVPAVKDRQGPSETLLAVMRLTEEGKSAAEIARRLRITPRQVYRLRQQAREHPELLTPKPKRRKMTRTTPEERRQRAVDAEQRRRERMALKQRKAEEARRQAIFGSEGDPTEIMTPRITPLPVERTDW
ncbi:MAG TPA: helix-turn-helix domain-containing protein [Armatimonadota bacterium]|nr:helix-turn-helix domain-containing protein [Armatimonadota bacterium]